MDRIDPGGRELSARNLSVPIMTYTQLADSGGVSLAYRSPGRTDGSNRTGGEAA